MPRLIRTLECASAKPPYLARTTKAPDDFVDQIDEYHAEDGADAPPHCDSDSDAGESDMESFRQTDRDLDIETNDGEGLHSPRTASSTAIDVEDITPPWDARL